MTRTGVSVTDDRFLAGLRWAGRVLQEPATTAVVAAGFTMRELTEISEALGECVHPVDEDGFCFLCDYPWEASK